MCRSSTPSVPTVGAPGRKQCRLRWWVPLSSVQRGGVGGAVPCGAHGGPSHLHSPSSAPPFLTPQSKNSVKSNFLTQDVIGSLPKGLTRTEKEAVAASTPLSPSLNLLNSLPKGQVFKRSAAGVALRRSVLRGSVIVFITAGYTGAGQGAGVSRNWGMDCCKLVFHASAGSPGRGFTSCTGAACMLIPRPQLRNMPAAGRACHSHQSLRSVRQALRYSFRHVTPPYSPCPPRQTLHLRACQGAGRPQPGGRRARLLGQGRLVS